MFKIFLMTIKRNFMKLPLVLSLIIFPLILIYILGSVVGSLQEKGVMIKETVCYINDLEGISKKAFDDFILSNAFDGAFIITQIDSKDEGEKAFESGKYKSMIYAVSKNGNHIIELDTVNDKTPLISILNAFVDTSNIAELIIKSGGTYSPPLHNDVFNRVMDDLGIPIGINYYSVQTLLQTLIMGGIFGIFSILEDYKKNVYVRINTSPISRFKVLGGRILANTVFLMLMALIMIIFSIILYDANWQGNIVIMTLVFFLLSSIIVGSGMLLAAMTKSTGVAIGILTMLQILWSNASGAFGPYDSKSLMAYASPNYNAKNAIFATIYGGSHELILTSIGILVIIMIIIYALFYLIDRRRANGYL